MLAGSGVRRAAGGMGLHRGRELLREIPCMNPASSYKDVFRRNIVLCVMFLNITA